MLKSSTLEMMVVNNPLLSSEQPKTDWLNLCRCPALVPITVGPSKMIVGRALTLLELRKVAGSNAIGRPAGAQGMHKERRTPVEGKRDC